MHCVTNSGLFIPSTDSLSVGRSDVNDVNTHWERGRTWNVAAESQYAVPSELNSSLFFLIEENGFISDCPVGYTAMDGACFMLLPKSMNFVQADRECQKQGGRHSHLSHFQTKDQFHTIKKFIKSKLYDSRHGNKAF